MKIKTNIRRVGGSLYLLLPPNLIKYLFLEAGDDVVFIQDDEGRFGRFASFWKDEEPDALRFQAALDETRKQLKKKDAEAML